MALKLVVDSIEELPEPIRGEYEERDGKFHLKVDGLEDTGALKKALDAERKARKENEAKVKRWEKLGKSDEEIAQLLADLEEKERKAAEESGDHQKILKQHQDAWAKREKELQDELQAARNSELSVLRSERIIGALAKAGATEEGTELLPDRLAGRIKFETVDGRRVIKIMQADGETPMAGSGADGTATIEDLVKEATTKYPSLFKGSGAGGSGAESRGPNGSGGVTRKSDFKSRKERTEWVDKHGPEAYAALAD